MEDKWLDPGLAATPCYSDLPSGSDGAGSVRMWLPGGCGSVLARANIWVYKLLGTEQCFLNRVNELERRWVSGLPGFA